MGTRVDESVAKSGVAVHGECLICGEDTFPNDDFCSKACEVVWDVTHPVVPAEPPLFTESVLSEDAAQRKERPIFSGVLNYFPLALAAVARISKLGNDQHNPGEPLHWARGKSMDHPDCIARHLIDIETFDVTTGEYEHASRLAWRALAKLQELEERRLGKSPCRGSLGGQP